MPQTDTDIAFGFDPQPFLNGIAQVNRGMDRMTDSAKKSAQGIGRAMFRAVATVELLKAALGKTFGFIRSLGRFIPELGKSFGIMKEVISKNLLWPLRQQLAPMLQKMLDWVRDNRALFAKWGEVLVNIFKAAVVSIKIVIKALKDLGEVLWPLIKGLFGFVNRDISDIINLVVAKIAVVIIYFGRLISRVVGFFTESGLADVIESMLNSVVTLVTSVRALSDAFTEGFGTKMESVMDGFRRLSAAIVGFFDAIFGGDGRLMEKAKDIMFEFGAIMGSVVTAGLNAAADVIELITDRIIKMKEAISDGKWMNAFEQMPGMGDFVRGRREAKEAGKGIFGQYLSGSKEAFTNMLPYKFVEGALKDLFGGKGEAGVRPSGGGGVQQDFLMRPGQGPVSFSPDDTIIGVKKPEVLGRGVTEVTQNVNVQLTVTEGNAKAAGEKFSEGLTQGLRLTMLDSMVAGGY